tara:strand:- start:106 stop:834 length:729 start_codon:yes stop_codon:yes gene_type:complete
MAAPLAPVEEGTKVLSEKPWMAGKGAFGQEWVGAFDQNTDIYHPIDMKSEQIPLEKQQEYLTKKSLGELTPQIMNNLEELRGPIAVKAGDFKPFDPSEPSAKLIDQQMEGVGVFPGRALPSKAPGPAVGGEVDQAAPPSSGSKSVEVHMVYGEWCGHSRRAKPAFEELVSVSDAKTSSGTPISFIMTTDDSEGMEQFKSAVRGFPTYMTVVKEGGKVTSMEELRLQNREKDTILNAAKSLGF